MPEGAVVCDTGPLFALFLTDQLEVLPRLYSRVLTPRAVLEEVTAGRSSSRREALTGRSHLLHCISHLAPRRARELTHVLR